MKSSFGTEILVLFYAGMLHFSEKVTLSFNARPYHDHENAIPHQIKFKIEVQFNEKLCALNHNVA